ncbi:MAG: sulfite exporter TauE/SafE family protein, partial [Thermogutta sp.]|nr:sulfite exporter TauE/SafE family protein [Thermogutta sp.]
MPAEWTFYIFGGLAAVFMGFAKTGMPGTSVLAVALMAQAFRHNAELSVGAMLPILLVGDVVAVVCYWRHTSWSRLGRLFPAVSIGLAIGFGVLHVIEGNELRPVLGLLVALMFIAELLRRRFNSGRVPQGRVFTSGVGVLAGFGTMAGNAAGPVMTLYLLTQELPKDRFMGTCAVFFFTVNVIKVVPYTLEG